MNKGDTILAGIGIVVLAAIVIAALMLGTAWVIMWAWNIFIAAIFHLPHINIWQGFAIDILLILIKPVVSYTKNGK